MILDVDNVNSQSKIPHGSLISHLIKNTHETRSGNIMLFENTSSVSNQYSISVRVNITVLIAMESTGWNTTRKSIQFYNLPI